MQKMVPCKGADEVLLSLNNLFSYCSHTKLGATPSRPCSLTFIISNYESLVLQHQKRANKTAETEPRYKIIMQE